MALARLHLHPSGSRLPESSSQGDGGHVNQTHHTLRPSAGPDSHIPCTLLTLAGWAAKPHAQRATLSHSDTGRE